MLMWRGGITGRLGMQEEVISVWCLEESWCCVSVIVRRGVLARSVRARVCVLLMCGVMKGCHECAIDVIWSDAFNIAGHIL